MTRLEERNLLQSIKSKRNYKDHTPLTLAAALGNKAMFEHILDAEREQEWAYGPVTCNLFPLIELDALDLQQILSHPYDVELRDLHCQRGALQVIIDSGTELFHHTRCFYAYSLTEQLDLLCLPRVRKLLDLKWEKFAAQKFWHRLGFDLVFMMMFTCKHNSFALKHVTFVKAQYCFGATCPRHRHFCGSHHL